MKHSLTKKRFSPNLAWRFPYWMYLLHTVPWEKDDSKIILFPIEPLGSSYVYHAHILDHTRNMHGTFMGMTHLSRNLTDAKEHKCMYIASVY